MTSNTDLSKADLINELTNGLTNELTNGLTNELTNFQPSDLQLVGGGLVGSMLSIFLARLGFTVDLFERRSDLRKNKISAGRSINLAISTRGLTALNQLGLKEQVLKFCLPMHGRAVHSIDGDVQFQPYGLEHECIYSVSRSDLNKVLLTEAEKSESIKIFFETKLVDLSFENKFFSIESKISNQTSVHKMQFNKIIGTDGTASVVREKISKITQSNYTYDQLTHSYKELIIPTGSGLDTKALHIWPRKEFLLIALPNEDLSFTATLFLADQGEVSFEKLKTESELHTFFKKYFKDVYLLLPNLTSEFFNNPTGHMVTIKTDHWFFDDQALIMGDASHGIVPFFGQGMNSGFEDCLKLHDVIEKHLSKSVDKNYLNWKNIFSDFFLLRKTNTDAIADMAKENFIEMRDKVSDPDFLFKKSIERQLMQAYPKDYISRYQLISFSNIPYRKAFEIGLIEDSLIDELSKNLDSNQKINFDQAQNLIQTKLSPHLKEYYELANSK